ncbi:hypothetical protein TraAM80_08057 [Trypanosoma rangeli]|uniref:Uncharacterized protein n=1 Tax=Trypanosoma rangeli TaxID=5698 RepID=A0A422N2T1_TRYRA|nr:uncharacterized protein TraAM80_08057 [Trypanosoma rangeli]RNE99763.1 hypothetical protein TraAM80_08057 [Trypanosoma rangeli]|eukprot:RNE99763.1 hypothetical protein TraAM80_08057 [Trypanosoma rangeli]
MGLRKALARPFVALVASMDSRIDRMDEPLKRHIQHHNKSGEDLCASVWHEYWSYQKALLSYRKTRFFSELSYITGGTLSVASIGVKDVILFSRAFTKCLFIFIICVLIGRRSVFPSLEPTSVFVEEINKNWQPNHKRGMVLRHM